MLKNRSVPADVVLPHITYRNVAEALAWLTEAFGFTEHYRCGQSGGHVDAHFARAKAAGAKIVEELHETGYGERQYGAEDLEGHHWLFSRHARDVSPEEWGAIPAATSRERWR